MRIPSLGRGKNFYGVYFVQDDLLPYGDRGKIAGLERKRPRYLPFTY